MGINLVVTGTFPFGSILPPHSTVLYRKLPVSTESQLTTSSEADPSRKRRSERLKRSKSHSDNKPDSTESQEGEKGSDEVTYFFGLMPPFQATFPVVDFDMSLLFNSLSILHIISVFECILGESKIVFLSTKAKLLTHVIQAFLTLIWPFSWVCSIVVAY